MYCTRTGTGVVGLYKYCIYEYRYSDLLVPVRTGTSAVVLVPVPGTRHPILHHLMYILPIWQIKLRCLCLALLKRSFFPTTSKKVIMKKNPNSWYQQYKKYAKEPYKYKRNLASFLLPARSFLADYFGSSFNSFSEWLVRSLSTNADREIWHGRFNVKQCLFERTDIFPIYPSNFYYY